MTQDVPVNGKQQINVRLVEDTQQLDEVVVVGYGTQKKWELTSSISSIKSETFIQGSVQDAAQLLQGKVAGLGIVMPNGDPTSSSQIVLRGIGSLKGDRVPLVIVDGVPGDMSTVAPEDIESIDVIKDGSAAAIYGTRGNNGVIFITTKKVKGETDPRIFGSIDLKANESEIIRPKGMKVTFLEGKDWEAEMGSKEGTFGEQYELAMGYKMCSRKWLDWTLPPTDDAGGHFFNGRAQGVNWRMIRYSDVLLMYAEAVVMGGKATANITPLEAINKVRDRVGVPHVTEANMRTIEDERILELTYEGFRFFDLLRWGKVVERFRELENTDPLFKRFSRAQYMGFKENKNEWVPLPIDEVEGNPYITKNNPGW